MPRRRAGGTPYDTASPDDPRGEVTNEDYVGALVRFRGGARGTLEACRVITGSQCDLAFEVHGTRGALAWSFERMNELRYFVSGAQGPPSFEDAAAVARVQQAIAASWDSGAW